MADQKIDKETANDIDLLQDVIGKALKAGADAADAVLVEGTSLSHVRRLGKTEKLERSEGQDLGLRVLVGKQQAIVSSSDRSPRMLAELVERQRAILDSAARLVKPGGRLIYATCSLLREENEAQAEAFLDTHPDFALYPAARAWAEVIGGPSPAGEDYLRLTPAQHGTDGFFVALFERKPS